MSKDWFVFFFVFLPIGAAGLWIIVCFFGLFAEQSASLDRLDPTRARRRGYWIDNPPQHVLDAEQARHRPVSPTKSEGET